MPLEGQFHAPLVAQTGKESGLWHACGVGRHGYALAGSHHVDGLAGREWQSGSCLVGPVGLGHRLGIVQQDFGVAEEYPVVVEAVGGLSGLEGHFVVEILLQIVARRGGVAQGLPVLSAEEGLHGHGSGPFRTVADDGHLQAWVAVLVGVGRLGGVVPVEGGAVFHLVGAHEVLRGARVARAPLYADGIVGRLEVRGLAFRPAQNDFGALVVDGTEEVLIVVV